MILIIGHDASLTGAPVLLLNFIRWMKQEHREELVIILKSDGPLLDKYRAIATTYVWKEPVTKRNLLYRIVNSLVDLSRIRERKMIRAIFRTRPQLILSNTIVNGDLIEKLRGHDIPVICWVHELENVIQQI